MGWCSIYGLNLGAGNSCCKVFKGLFTTWMSCLRRIRVSGCVTLLIISNILQRKFSKPTTHAIPMPEELVCMFFKWAAPQENPSLAVLPFINGVMQPLTRILRRRDIQVVNKPLKTLQQEFPSPKFRPSIEHQPNVVYKIPCAHLCYQACWQ